MEEVEVEEERNQKAAKPIKISGKGIGLQIITKKSIGWPKGTLDHKQIIEGIKVEKYKFIFTSTAYDEEEIYHLLKNDLIDLTEAWVAEDDSIFRKIRNGLYQEKKLDLPKDVNSTKDKTPN
ncbi:hypothetical protein E2C01_036929 [Portunus trituberculatus]|uniref:Uncharacterized protein n=1 Tax=Portunus trituberculatus TaxID=210409 RepID=A0A5B7FD96_PORTR|nr:hypothetical protein [Portunus trituberculatus]